VLQKTKYQGNWLDFHEVYFTNSAGESREWEYATLTGTDGVACVVAIKENPEACIILIKQFRPPIGNYYIEFPAGLFDSGESIEAAAVRELEKETEYTVTVLNIGPKIYSSPRLTDKKIFLVTLRIETQSEKSGRE